MEYSVPQLVSLLLQKEYLKRLFATFDDAPSVWALLKEYCKQEKIDDSHWDMAEFSTVETRIVWLFVGRAVNGVGIMQGNDGVTNVCNIGPRCHKATYM